MTRSRKPGELLAAVLTAADPSTRLNAITELRRELDAMETEAAADALHAGLSWREIGVALGITKQAAHRRHSRGVGEVDRAAATEDAGVAAAVSAEVRRAVRLSRREAGSAGLTSVGTEHLLLGVLGCGDPRTVELLRGAGVTAAAARSAMESTHEIPLSVAQRAVAARDGDGASSREALLSPLARLVVSHALGETARRGGRSLSALDLLSALLSEDRGGAAQTLRALGVSSAQIRQRILDAERASAPEPLVRPGSVPTGAAEA